MLVTQNTGQKRKIQKDETKFRLYNSINDRSQMLTLKPGYEIYPSAAEIFERRFIINNLTIKNRSTIAQWRGLVNLRNLKRPLYELIDLGRNHIEVYPNQHQKPMAGTQLNRICFVTFSNLKPLNKRKLMKICESNQCQLLAIKQSQFTVEIPHFSKYTFDGQYAESQDEEKQERQLEQLQKKIKQQEAKKKQEKQEEPNLVKQLKTRHAQRLVRQQQQTRKAQTISFVEGVKNTLPSLNVQDQIHEYNMRNGHQLDENRMHGTPTTIGINCNVSTYIRSTNLHFLLFNKQKQHKTELLKLALDLIADESKITDYIFLPSSTLKLQRVLTLNVICFKFHQCYFDFQRKENGLELVRTSTVPPEHHQSRYFKDWFEWAINKDAQNLRIDNQMLKALVLRKTSAQADKCFKFNQHADSQFLTSIQDESYRFGEAPRNLSRQLRAISVGDMNYFNHFPWLVRFGVYLWYYCFKQQPEQKLIEILNSQEPVEDKIQHYILSIYLGIPFNNQMPTNIHQSEYPLWLYIENSNAEQQKQINKIENKNISSQGKNNRNKIIIQQPEIRPEYRNYLFNLVWSVVDMYGDCQVALQLVFKNRFLMKDEKDSVLTNFINKYPVQAERLPVQRWGDSVDLLYIRRALAHYTNKDYIKSLQYFAKCWLVSDEALNVLKRIMKKQEVICGIHKKTIQKIKNLLHQIKTPNNDLVYEQMFLNTVLGKQQLESSKVREMIEMCYGVYNDLTRTKMLEIIFRQAIKNPTVIAELKRDQQFYKKMQEIYTDTQYLLEMKLVRLEL